MGKEEAQVFNIGRDKAIKKRKQQDEDEGVFTCRNYNHQYPKVHRHNCQRGMRPEEKEQLRRRYRRRGHNADIRNREFNERATQQETKLRRYDNHRINIPPVDRPIILEQIRTLHQEIFYGEVLRKSYDL